MAKKDKILDILSLSKLSEDAKLARLAHRWIGKHVPREQAKAIVKVYFDANGRTPELTDRFLAEKHHQEKIHNERQAFAEAEAARQLSPMLKYKDKRLRQKRVMEIAQRTFGPAVRENFNEDTLTMMSLISGEDRWYQIRWLAAGFQPKRSALIEVITVSKTKGSQHNRFLLYRAGRRVLVARTTARDLEQAWGSQLPEAFMLQAGTLKQNGWSFSMDYEGQEMVASKQRASWTPGSRGPDRRSTTKLGRGPADPST